MKIGYKLILGFLLVALLASFTTFTALRSYQNIDGAFERLITEPLPIIQVLEDLRVSGNRIVSSTSELVVIYGEAALIKKNEDKGENEENEAEVKEVLESELAEEEQQLLISGYSQYDDALKRYEILINSSRSTDTQYLQEIGKNGDALKKLSSEIIELKKKGITGEEVLELRENLENQEVSYFQAVDAALKHEYEQMVNEQANVHETISQSTRTTYLVTLMTFILAISAGLYISRTVANRIGKLKEASEKIGRGQLEAQIEIETNDELGDLARSFNKMAGDLKTSRADLFAAKNFTEKILHSMVDFVVVTDMDLTIKQVNEAALRINGYKEHELIGQSVNILMADRHFNRKGVDVLREKGFVSNIDKLNLNKDGSVTPISMSLSILKDDKDNEIGIVCVGKDVTERKRAEKEMKRLNQKIENQRQRLNDILENIPCMIWEAPLDPNDKTVQLGFVNNYVTKMFGYSPEEWFSTPDFWQSRLYADDREALFRAHERLFTKGFASNQARWINRNGQIIWGDTQIVLVKNETGKPIGLRGVTTDITERKKLEHELRESEESYRAFIERSTEGIWRFEFDKPMPTDIPVDEQITYALNHAYLAECNNAMAQMYGFESAGDLLNMRLGEFLIHSDDTNSNYFIEFVQNNYRLNDAETHEVSKSGEDKYFLNNMVGIFENGKLISAWGTQRDITERRKSEEQLKIFNRKLQQSNRELQDFAYVASHDLQEPLRKIQTFGDRLKAKYADKLEDGGLDYLERMRSAAHRMQTLIQDLLSFSRVTTKAQPFAPVDLEKITCEVLSDLEVKIEETGATVEIENLPTIEADPSQMRQLIQNLVGNALKFRRDDVSPVIKISTGTNVHHANGNGAKEKEQSCKITVKDNGIGFDEKYLDKIFTVFQRLHGRAEYEGSGVGLAVCRKIVERHHGSITAHSAPGEGASFIITLPLEQKLAE